MSDSLNGIDILWPLVLGDGAGLAGQGSLSLS
jgi:hypothetical protein